MNKEFQWNDDLVREFALQVKITGTKEWIEPQLASFKASHTEVKGVDWEIVTYKGDGYIVYHRQPDGRFKESQESLNIWYEGDISHYPIHSVRRLSDNSIWVVGDEIDHKDSLSVKKIDSFYITDKNEMACICSNPNSRSNYFIENWTKPLQRTPLPILKTEDGVNIFDDHDDELWRIFVSPSSYEMWKPYELGLPQYPVSGELYFSTKKAADEYIILNKPFMSVQIIMDRIHSYFSNPNDAFNNLKQMAQQKIDKQ